MNCIKAGAACAIFLFVMAASPEALARSKHVTRCPTARGHQAPQCPKVDEYGNCSASVHVGGLSNELAPSKPGISKERRAEFQKRLGALVQEFQQ